MIIILIEHCIFLYCRIFNLFLHSGSTSSPAQSLVGTPLTGTHSTHAKQRRYFGGKTRTGFRFEFNGGKYSKDDISAGKQEPILWGKDKYFDLISSAYLKIPLYL